MSGAVPDQASGFLPFDAVPKTEFEQTAHLTSTRSLRFNHRFAAHVN